MAKRYVVCWPNEYVDRNGDNQSEFMKVGAAFPLRDRDGFSVELSLMPPTAAPGQPTRLVLFAVDENRDDNRNNDNNRNDRRDRRDNNRGRR